MGQRARLAALTTLGAALLAGGCAREEERRPAPVETAAPTRPDSAEPGELAEGKQKAFELPVPRRMSVEARFPDAVFASGNVSIVDVMKYVKARIGPSATEGGAGKIAYLKTHVKAAPDRPVRVELVDLGGNRTQLVVRDLTPPKVDPSITPEEHLRRAGLNANGELLDPTKVE